SIPSAATPSPRSSPAARRGYSWRRTRGSAGSRAEQRPISSPASSSRRPWSTESLRTFRNNSRERRNRVAARRVLIGETGLGVLRMSATVRLDEWEQETLCLALDALQLLLVGQDLSRDFVGFA